MARPLNELYGAAQAENGFSAAFWNSFLEDLNGRVAALEQLRGGLQSIVAAGQSIALERTNEILGPAQRDLAARLAEADARLAALGPDLEKTLEEGRETVSQWVAANEGRIEEARASFDRALKETREGLRGLRAQFEVALDPAVYFAPPVLRSASYDDEGNATRIEDAFGDVVRVTEPAYGADGSVTSVTTTIGGTVRVETFNYDGAGNVTGSTVTTREVAP